MLTTFLIVHPSPSITCGSLINFTFVRVRLCYHWSGNCIIISSLCNLNCIFLITTVSQNLQFIELHFKSHKRKFITSMTKASTVNAGTANWRDSRIKILITLSRSFYSCTQGAFGLCLKPMHACVIMDQQFF